MLKRADEQISLLQPARLAQLLAPLEGIASIGLAVSGGPDSLALMAMAARWRDARARRPNVTVFTVDHGLRPEAVEEARLVARYASEVGLEAITLRWEGEKPGTGLQAAARTARYRLIGEVMDWRDIAVLVTAHHMDDQAETILMRIAHGSGVTGLAGMASFSEVEGVKVFRPLLQVRHSELEAVVEAIGWTAVNDPSNADPRFERARWRAAMPSLEALGLTVERLAQFGARLGRADAALSEAAERAFERVVKFDGFGAGRLNLALLAALQPAIRLRVLARAIDEAGGAARAPDLSQVEALEAALGSGATLAATTVGGCRIAVEAGRLLIQREPGRLRTEEAVLRPGGRLVWDQRFEISTSPDAPTMRVAAAGPMPAGELAALAGGTGGAAAGGAAAAAAAPKVSDGETILALGTFTFDSRVKVRLLIGPRGGAKR
ncbi:MAG: tRNA lysidine(34) synthetase TilS [Cucumibacter sp.]